MQHFEKRISTFLDLGLSEKALPALKAYTDLLWKTNDEFNLVSRKMTFEELIDNHIIDCLLPLKHFPKNIKTVADFGSGGGLPAVIFAIQFPEIQFHLFEKSKLKQKFLNECKKITKNIYVYAEIPNQFSGYDLVIARGFKPIDEIIHFSRDYYKKQGRYFLMKARREKIDEEIDLALKKDKNFKCEIIKLTSPVLDVERHIVLF